MDEETTLKAMLTDVLTETRKTSIKMDVANEKIDTLADLVGRHDISLYGRDDKDGIIGRVGRMEERFSGRIATLEGDVKRIYAGGSVVLTAVILFIVGRLLNLI